MNQKSEGLKVTREWICHPLSASLPLAEVCGVESTVNLGRIMHAQRHDTPLLIHEELEKASVCR